MSHVALLAPAPPSAPTSARGADARVGRIEREDSRPVLRSRLVFGDTSEVRATLTTLVTSRAATAGGAP